MKNRKPVNPLKACPSLAGSLVFQVNRANEIILARSQRFSQKRWGISPRSCWVLLCIDGSLMSQRKVADILHINYNVMVDELDALEKKGIVQRLRNPENRREHMLKLTPAGKKISKAIIQAQIDNSVFSEVFAPLPLSAIKELVVHVRAIMESATEETD